MKWWNYHFINYIQDFNNFSKVARVSIEECNPFFKNFLTSVIKYKKANWYIHFLHESVKICRSRWSDSRFVPSTGGSAPFFDNQLLLATPGSHESFLVFLKSVLSFSIHTRRSKHYTKRKKKYSYFGQIRWSWTKARFTNNQEKHYRELIRGNNLDGHAETMTEPVDDMAAFRRIDQENRLNRKKKRRKEFQGNEMVGSDCSPMTLGHFTFVDWNLFLGFSTLCGIGIFYL